MMLIAILSELWRYHDNITFDHDNIIMVSFQCFLVIRTLEYYHIKSSQSLALPYQVVIIVLPWYHDQRGTRGENMKKEKRRKQKKKEKKRMKNGLMRLFSFRYLRRGHQFDHVSGEYKEEEVKTAFNKITSFFSPLY
jgi:hypothetical protein